MRRLTLLLTASMLACGPGPASDETGVTIAQYRSGLTMGSAGGCDTSIAAGLANQLVEELNCVTPNLMVNFSGSHVTLYSGVTPFLAPDAARDIKDATVARNDTITISSAYRTLSAQALLYRWWQAGQCGIQLAAVPGSSNHQSGRAIDTPYYSYWKSTLAGQGWTWLGSSDVVHFDHLASPNIASKSVLAFQRLWNKNHSTGRLAEDGQWGPATSSAMSASPTTGFAVHGCPTTGKLAGTITEQGGGALAGVTVTAGGKTATTTSTGAFEFTLPGGAVTLTATKTGFTTGTLSRTVQVGATVSASLALARLVTTTTLTGTVVEQANPATPIPGANVSVGGQMLTTNASGVFQATLPAGAVSLTISKPGFVVHTSSVTLVAGTPKTVQLALEASGPDQPPVLSIDTPVSGGGFELSGLVLAGSAVDDSGPLASISLVQDAAPAVTVPVTAGHFEAPVRLAPGLNTVTLTATDAAGHATQLTWTGVFRAGFSGLVHRYDATAALVADAELTLFDPDTQVLLATTRSDLEGHFTLDANTTGVARLHVEANGFTPRDLLVDLSPDERTSVDVGLTPGDRPALRFIEPSTEGPFDADELTVSGVVTGFEVASVTVNGVQAMLLGNGFLVHVTLPEGRTTLEAIAENPEGGTVRAEVTVLRPMGDVRGGCAAVPGLSLLALGLFLLRRRSPRGALPRG